MNPAEYMKRLETKCQACGRPLPAVNPPAVCGSCWPQYVKDRVIALQRAVALLVSLRGGYVEIDKREADLFDDQHILETWDDPVRRVYCIRVRPK